jgi:hypothetical protein
VKTKSKVISRVVALVLALVMAVSSGITVFAAGLNANRADKAATVGKNWVDWVELLNDDACEAMLDAADEFLKDLDLTHLASSGIKDDTHTLPMVMSVDSSMNDNLADDGYVHVFLGNQKLANGLYPTGGSTSSSDVNNTTTSVAPGINRVYLFARAHIKKAIVDEKRTILVNGYADSVDGILDLLCQVYKNVLNNSSLVLSIPVIGTYDFIQIVGGDQVQRLKTSLAILNTINTTSSNDTGYYVSATDTSRCGKSWRKAMGAKNVMKLIAKILDALAMDNNTNNLLYSALSGTLSLGSLNDTVGLYYKPGDYDGQTARDKGIIGGLVTGDKAPIWDQYENNGMLLYNGLAAWVMNHELPTADDGRKVYYGDGATIVLPTSGALGDYTKITSVSSQGCGDNKTYTANYGNASGSGSYNGEKWNYDKVILDCISRNVLQKIVIDVTYPEFVENEDGNWVHDSSMARFKRGDAAYDSNLKLNADGKVYLFQYGNDKLTLGVNDNLYDFAYRALRIAWKTVLKPTLHLVQVNYNGHEVDGKGTNFDNAFLKWYIENKATGTVRSFPATAYTDGSVDEWAAAVYSTYGAASAAEFLENVERTYDYDEARQAKNDAYNWRDIEVTSLFNQVRYSPLADKYFHRRTGPANLYFLQTGTSNIDAFMDRVYTTPNTYAGIPEALNDFLIAAVKDIFPDSANIGYNAVADGTYSNIAQPSGFDSTTTFNAATIMGNIYKVLEYVANTTNANILNPYYAKNNITYNGTAVNLTAANIEEALIPFGIAVLKQWNLTAVIHNSDWDKVSDLESAAVVALKEYLGYVFPDRDYSYLWKEEVTAIGSTGKSYKLIKANTSSLYNEAIYWMARDAAAYVSCAAGVPVVLNDSKKTPWDPYTMWAQNHTEAASDPFAMIDAVACYFASVNERYDQDGTNAKSKGLAALLGLGTDTIKSSKTLWANLDAVFARVLPVSGELQYKYTNKTTNTGAYQSNGAFSSEELVKNIIIGDVLDFNLGNLLDGLYRILSSAPIKTRHVNKVLYYDILAPVLNSILGVNSLNSGSYELIPTANSETPFDVFLQAKNIAGLGDSGIIFDYGIISRLLHNLRLYFTDGASEYFYDAGTFLFMTLGMPGQLKEHEYSGVDIKIFDTDIYGTSASTTIKVKNDSYGINRFFHNQGDLNAAKQAEASRYWLNVKSIKIQTAAGTDAATLLSTNTTLAPEKNLYYTPSWTATRDSLYKVVVTYDVKFDDTLTNGTATAAAAASSTKYSNLTASKWIYVTPTSYTQTWANQGKETFSGEDFKKKNDNYVGSVVTGSAANDMEITAGSMYDVTASDVASEGYGVRIINSATAKKTGKFYVYPAAGTAMKNKNGAAVTVPANQAPAMAFLAIDEEGNIYNKDGGVYGKFDDLKSNNWIMGYQTTTNLDGEEVFAFVLANAWNTPPEVAFGAPGAGTVIADVTELGYNEGTNADHSWNNFALFKSGSTLAAKYTVGFAFATSASARAVVNPITLAYCGNMDSLKWAVDRYTDVLGASNTAVQAGAKAACIRYRNNTNVDAWTNADRLADAIYKAGENAAKTRAEAITTMSEEADAKDEIDYKVIGFKRWKKYVEKAENLREAKPIVVKKDGEPVLDEDGNEIPVLDAKGRPTYEYKTAENGTIVSEFVRTADLYKGYMEERAHTLDRIKAEVIHATSPCDDYDVVGNVQNDFTKFTATAGSAVRHHVVLDDKGVPALDDNDLKVYENTSVDSYRFAYSTKDNTVADNVNVYTEIATTATEVKFGAVENGKLVNKGETHYTTDSWNAYIDALGEVITSINNNDPISKTYTATTHLVMAENELTPGDEEEPPVGDTITVSGKVLIAADAAGNSGNFGLRGVVVAALDGEGNVVAQTTSDAGESDSTWGDFTLEVPAGTTRFVVGDPANADTIANREFTITGDADVTDANVPVVMCDYNDDGAINGTDTGQYTNALRGAYSIYADFNNDGAVNGTDTGQYTNFLRGCKNGINYGSELSF